MPAHRRAYAADIPPLSYRYSPRWSASRLFARRYDMNTDETWRTLGQNLAILTVVMTFTASLAGCGGSSGGNPVADTASTSGTSSGGGSSSSSGGGSSSSSGGGSSSSSGGGSSS